MDFLESWNNTKPLPIEEFKNKFETLNDYEQCREFPKHKNKP